MAWIINTWKPEVRGKCKNYKPDWLKENAFTWIGLDNHSFKLCTLTSYHHSVLDMSREKNVLKYFKFRANILKSGKMCRLYRISDGGRDLWISTTKTSWRSTAFLTRSQSTATLCEMSSVRTHILYYSSQRSFLVVEVIILRIQWTKIKFTKNT